MLHWTGTVPRQFSVCNSSGLFLFVRVGILIIFRYERLFRIDYLLTIMIYGVDTVRSPSELLDIAKWTESVSTC
jgi:hypothetical protein